MMMFYNFTRIEKWITDEYLKNNIHTPEDIDIEKLASVYNVAIWMFPMDARYDIFNGKKIIVIDSRTTIEEQREQFFHELCHILFHVGHQSRMHEPFREMLEWEADNFVMYAALPYHMIERYDLTNEYLIHELASEFKVTKTLCQKRMEQIKNRIQNNTSLVVESSSAYNLIK